MRTRKASMAMFSKHLMSVLLQARFAAVEWPVWRPHRLDVGGSPLKPTEQLLSSKWFPSSLLPPQNMRCMSVAGEPMTRVAALGAQSSRRHP